jgi:predicted amidohydrolase YtcJ
VSVHAISPAAIDLVLDAFEAALGPTGPNPLRHRIKHAVQVTDEQLARPAGASRHLDDAVTRLTHIATILPG